MGHQFYRIFLFFFLSASLYLLTACTTSMEDFYEEGEGIITQLIQELGSIHTREDLLKETPQLKKLFNRLVDVIIATREFQLSHFNVQGNDRQNYELSETLRLELNRIYSLEGGRKIIENCQEQALNRLDTFEKRINKKQN